MIDVIKTAVDYVLRRGASARDALENPAISEAFNSVRDDLRDELLNTRSNESEKRERLYLAIRALDDVRIRLNSFISASEYERQKLEESAEANSGQLYNGVV